MSQQCAWEEKAATSMQAYVDKTADIVQRETISLYLVFVRI